MGMHCLRQDNTRMQATRRQSIKTRLAISKSRAQAHELEADSRYHLRGKKNERATQLQLKQRGTIKEGLSCQGDRRQRERIQVTAPHSMIGPQNGRPAARRGASLTYSPAPHRTKMCSPPIGTRDSQQTSGGRLSASIYNTARHVSSAKRTDRAPNLPAASKRKRNPGTSLRGEAMPKTKGDVPS